MVTDLLLLLLHRHPPRIRPRRVPRNPLQAETRRTPQESFTTATPRVPHPSLSSPSRRSSKAKRSQHQSGSLGILQVPRQRLFCILWFKRCNQLLRHNQTTTQRVLLSSTPREDEMPLLQPPGPDHVPHRQKPREVISQVLQSPVSFLSVGGSRPLGKKPTLVRRRQVHSSL